MRISRVNLGGSGCRVCPGGWAFTLVEVLVALGVSSLILILVCSVFLSLGKANYSVMAYSDMQADERYAASQFLKDIRSCRRVAGFTNNVLTLQNSDGVDITYTYDPVGSNWTKARLGVSRALLQSCTNLTYSFFARPATNSNAAVGVLAVSDAANAGLVAVSWVCVRNYGSVAGNHLEGFSSGLCEIRNR